MQAPLFDGFAFDPFSSLDDGWCPAEVGIGGCDVVEALVVALVVDDDQLIYVNNVIKGKLLESEELRSQAQNNSKTQFASSPTLSNAILDAMAAHENMSSQALNSAKVREGLRDILLGPGQLYEALRSDSDKD